MKKALIIGGAGFVGQYLAEHLYSNCGWEVCVTKLANETLELPFAEVLDLNILEKEQVEMLLKEVEPDYIFHLAAQSSVALSWKNPKLTVDVNINGSLNVLEAVKNLEYKPKVLLIGSGEEYGKIKAEECPINEENVLRPGNIYAATKACQNMLGKIYSDAYGLEIINIRAFNHIGPGQSPIFVVSDFCKQVAEIEAGRITPVICVGNLEAQRDFTDVRDVVRAYAMLAERGTIGETYNVGSGKAVSIRELLDRIVDMSTERNIKIVVSEDKKRPIDVPIIEADISKLVQDTKWERLIPVEQTIKETLEYWRKKIYIDI